MIAAGIMPRHSPSSTKTTVRLMTITVAAVRVKRPRIISRVQMPSEQGGKCHRRIDADVQRVHLEAYHVVEGEDLFPSVPHEQSSRNSYAHQQQTHIDLPGCRP